MSQRNQEQPAGLISVLLDRDAEFGDRDDAAMDLGAFDAPEAADALTHILLDAAEDRDLAASAAESLGEIWARNRRFDRQVFDRLEGTAALMVTAVLDARWPEWRAGSSPVDAVPDS